MKIDKELESLAKQFKKHKHTLYIVGGFVRDNLLGLTPSDIDITSSMPYSEVINLCKKLKIKTIPVNKKLGTLQIVIGNNIYEYTQFRSESYSEKGSHSPDKVEFVNDIKIDCFRRDLTINSLYYDISNKKVIDLVDGTKHLKNKIIKTTNKPEITLQDDGLRILRVIRFASLLNFKIDRKTLSTIKMFSGHLSKISKERIIKEISYLAISDLKHNLKNTIFLKYIFKLKLLPQIFNSSLERVKNLTKQDVSNYYKLSYDSRIIGFYFLVIKNYLKGFSQENQLPFVINMILGNDGIKESKNNINLVEKLYRIYQNLYYNNDSLTASLNYLCLSDNEREIIDAFLNKNGAIILANNKDIIKRYNFPLNIHELKVSGEDLKNENIDGKYIGKILSVLFNQVIALKVENKKEDLIKLALEIHNNFKNIN